MSIRRTYENVASHFGRYPEQTQSLSALPFYERVALTNYAAETGRHSLYERLVTEQGLEIANRNKNFYKFKRLVKQFPKIPPEYFDGVEIYPLVFTKLKNYLVMADLFSQECDDVRRRNQHAYKAFLLFETADKYKKFVKKTAKAKWRSPLMNTINQIPMPAKGVWRTVDFRAWGEAYLQYGLQATNPLFSTAAKYIRPVKNRHSISLRDSWAEILKVEDVVTMNKESASQLIQEIQRWKLNPREVRILLDVLSLPRQKPKIEKTVPDIELDGRSFDMGYARFRKLDADDMRMFFIGKYTNCCEWVGGEYFGYNATPEHAYKERTSNFYVVEDKEDGSILAHSWVWRGSNGDLVFDGFESATGSSFRVETIIKIMDCVVSSLANESYAEYKIGNVFLGKCKHAFMDSINAHYKDGYRMKASELMDEKIGANTQNDFPHLIYIGNPERLLRGSQYNLGIIFPSQKFY